MRRFGSWAMVGNLLLPLAWALGAASVSPDAERVRQFERDQNLIQTLVESGIELAGEDDPLRRAAQCNKLADRFAREISQAAAAKNSPRVKTFGEHLQDLLTVGVAGNLAVARGSLPAGSPQERTLVEFGKEVKQLEANLGRTTQVDGKEVFSALTAVRHGREEVEKAIRGKNNPKHKGKGPPWLRDKGKGPWHKGRGHGKKKGHPHQ
jgi:hypothetical protein